MTNVNTREKLIDAFFEIYKEKPIHKISIKEITDFAGYHRSTFYEYFQDIYDLLKQEEEEILSTHKKNVLDPIVKDKMFLSDDDIIIKTISKFMDCKGERILFLIGPKGDPLFRERFKLRVQGAIQTILPVSDELKSSLIADFVSAGILSVLSRLYSSGDFTVADFIQFTGPVRKEIYRFLITNTD